MRQILFSIICSLSFSVGTIAQTSETFDIATFQPPNGWKKQSKPGVVIFNTANEQKGTYAMIMLFASGESSGNAKGDFEGDWQEFIAGQLGIKGKPDLEPVAKKDGWDVVSGGAAFENEIGPSAVILRTYSGFGKALSAAAIFNSEDSLPAIEAFAASIKLKKTGAEKQQPQTADDRTGPARIVTGDGYTFATSNFDDGWNAAIKSDWVEVTKGATTVLLHYGITITDEMRQDLSNSYWNKIAANKYNIRNLYPTNYSVLKDFPYYFVQADATEKATGKSVFVSFQVIPKNGTAYCYEIVTPTKSSFSQQFPTMDKIENLSGYNRFAIGKNDLVGTWQAGGGAFTQYYFVSSGNYAGMNITVSNLKYVFVNGTSYRTEVKAVTNNIYASEKEIGKYTVGNWDVSTTDQKGKLSNFSAWFEATKGGRILHLLNKKYSSEHYLLGKDR
jgi:hypothetical protein